MALINIDTALKRAGEILDKIAPPQGLEILTYKRNRGVGIVKLTEGRFLLREHGYREEENEVGRDELDRRIKAIAKREFPRSRKVRFYQLDGPDALDQPRKKL